MAEEITTEKAIITTANTNKPFKVYYVLYYILSIIETLLLIRFLFRLFGANPGSGFVSFIYSLTAPLVMPFTGIFPIARENTSVLDPSTLVAMVVYSLLFYGIAQLIRIVTADKPEDIDHPTVE